MMILAGVLPAGGGRPERKALEAQELRVELLEHSSAVWVGGYRSQMSLEQAFGGGKLPLDASDACEDTPMAAFINTGEPLLSWSLKATGPEAGCTQVAYRVRVASSLDLLRAGKADVWDSGKVISAAQSCRIRPDGNAPILKERRFTIGMSKSGAPLPEAAGFARLHPLSPQLASAAKSPATPSRSTMKPWCPTPGAGSISDATPSRSSASISRKRVATA